MCLLSFFLLSALLLLAGARGVCYYAGGLADISILADAWALADMREKAVPKNAEINTSLHNLDKNNMNKKMPPVDAGGIFLQI